MGAFFVGPQFLNINVIASEAKQSNLRFRALDCFVAALLAMTTERAERSYAQG